MFPAAAFTPDWITTQRRQLGNCDPAILERCVHALTLLGYLVESGLPFIFKGGTSLLLHLPEVRRLSIDIDIVCGEKRAVVNEVVARIGKMPPFLRSEESIREHLFAPLPKRRHFKFYYRSALGSRPELPILLDVVEETRVPHIITELPIRTSFLTPEREIKVKLPTLESLLGDKLTAFAPSTTGVLLRKSDGTPGDVMQVAKQLFDVGVLFPSATKYNELADTYYAVQELESEYRESRPTREAALKDTIQACLAVAATAANIDDYPDARLLQDGFQRLQGHITWPGFAANREHRRTMAARAAVLAAHLQAGVPFDFVAHQYTNSPEQIEALRAASLAGTPLVWLDRVKGVNPEAYHYFHRAIQLGPTKPV